MSDTTNRRDFIKTAAAAGIGIVLTSSMEKSAQAQAVPDATAAPAPAAAPARQVKLSRRYAAPMAAGWHMCSASP